MWFVELRLILFILLFVSVVSSAQEPADTSVVRSDSTVVEEQPRKLGYVRRTVREFDRLNTDYIEPQHYIFTVMLQGTYAYDHYSLSTAGSDRQRIAFAPDMNLRVGPYFGWKWIFAGYTFELGNINLSKIKQELDLSIYSSQIGLDLFYRRTGSEYKLRDADFGDNVDASPLNNVPFDGLKAGITGFNVYYIFNHGKFSYPAAFAQSTIQKISCGSWMAGVGYTRNSVELDHDRLQRVIDERLGRGAVKLDSGLMFNSASYHDINLSAGYAYNWVFAKNWLLGASLQAALAYKYSSGNVIGGLKDFSFRDVNIDGIGRFGLVYNCMRWYAGTSVILHSNNYHKPRFSTNNTFGSWNVYVGFNFLLKKKYRQKDAL
ncbi:MAG: DUF4421 domain-containing protein [Prevotella sp.]|nr:DUF4421 domain-containing protein [Prevotella sp.]